MARFRLEVESTLESAQEVLWAHLRTMAGVNAELWPMKMSAPPGFAFDARTPLRKRLFASQVTLLGFLPLDLHHLIVEAVWPGRGFHERSRTFLEVEWEHVRTLAPQTLTRTVLRDVVTFQPRLFPGLVARIAALTFSRRHRYLRLTFGGEGGPPKVALQRLD